MPASNPSELAGQDLSALEASYERLSDDELRATIRSLEAELNRRLRALVTGPASFADTSVVEWVSRWRQLLNRMRERLGELPFCGTPDGSARGRFELALSEGWSQVREVLRLQPSTVHQLPSGDR